MGYDKFQYECIPAHRIAGPWWARRKFNASGFTNAELAIGVGIIAVLLLLSQVQSGEISFGSTSAKPVTKKSGKSSGKQPEFTYPQAPQPVSPEAIQFVEARQAEIKADKQRLVDVSRAVAHMEPKKAVLLLGGLDTAEVAAVLVRLDSHYIAHIFDAASHQESAAWLQELLLLPEYSAIPEEYRLAAEEAGLIEPNEGGSLPGTSDPVEGLVDDAGNVDPGGSGTTPAEETANGGVALEGQPSPTENGGADPGFNVA